MEIEQDKETKLESAKIEDGFYNMIGGQRSAGGKLSVINPATGKELATVPDIAAASLDDAVDAARKAFPAWRALPFARRKEILNEVLTEIDRHAEELSVLLTAEQGRPLFQARWEIDLLRPNSMGRRSCKWIFLKSNRTWRTSGMYSSGTHRLAL